MPGNSSGHGGRERTPGRRPPLLAHGADPDLRDDEGRTPLALCRERCAADDRPGRDEVEAILGPLTGVERTSKRPRG
jgi:hypothetical protein